MSHWFIQILLQVSTVWRHSYQLTKQSGKVSHNLLGTGVPPKSPCVYCVVPITHPAQLPFLRDTKSACLGCMSKNSANIYETFHNGFLISNRFQLMDIPSKIGFLCICNPEWIFFRETYLTLSFSQMLQATMYCGKGCFHQLPAPWAITTLLWIWTQRMISPYYWWFHTSVISPLHLISC